MSEFCRCCESLSDNSSVRHKCYSLFKNIQAYTHCQVVIDFNVIQALFECAHVKIYEDDGLSPLICSSCLAKLEVCVTFRQQIIKSELNQRKFLNKSAFPLIIYQPILIEDESLEQEVLKKQREKKRKRKVVDLTDKDESEVEIIEESVKIAEQSNIRISDVSVNNQIEEAIPNYYAEGNHTIVNNDSTKSNKDLFLYTGDCQENLSNLLELNPLGVESDDNIQNEVPDGCISPLPTQVYVECIEGKSQNSQKRAKLSLQSSFRCDVCFKQFGSLDELSAHKMHFVRKKNLDMNLYQCHTCLQEFCFSTDLHLHYRSTKCRCVIKESGLICALCPERKKVFDTVDAINAHIKFYHAPGAHFTTSVVSGNLMTVNINKNTDAV